jgi:hypothetical protein
MIEPGQKVRNRISGIEGYVAMRTENLSGWVWLHVQPPVDDAKASEEPKIVSGDECEWEAIEGSVPRLDAPRVPEARFELGQRVKDKITGFKGIATSRTEHLNRCWSYDVQAEKLRKDSKATGAFETFQSNRLELVDDGLFTRIVTRPTGPKGDDSASRKGY